MLYFCLLLTRKSAETVTKHSPNVKPNDAALKEQAEAIWHYELYPAAGEDEAEYFHEALDKTSGEHAELYASVRQAIQAIMNKNNGRPIGQQTRQNFAKALLATHALKEEYIQFVAYNEHLVEKTTGDEKHTAQRDAQRAKSAIQNTQGVETLITTLARSAGITLSQPEARR